MLKECSTKTRKIFPRFFYALNIEVYENENNGHIAREHSLTL